MAESLGPLDDDALSADTYRDDPRDPPPPTTFPADVWMPPDAADPLTGPRPSWPPPDHPMCRSEPPPGTPHHAATQRWWRDALDAALEEMRQAQQQLLRRQQPQQQQRVCTFCCDGVQRPEALRVVQHDVHMHIVNGAPYRYEVTHQRPCCLVCWQRLCFAQYLVQIGALSDWWGGVRHDIKAVMPPVADLNTHSTESGPLGW